MDNNRRCAKEEYYRKDQDEILAFGYSCKLFRDDEKAGDIDKGIHLIPCMADPNLMIDRFDVRGALTDLKEAESKGNAQAISTEAEQYEEKACEFESYCDYPVYNNYNDEERLFYDEEQKRLQMELSADTYTYNQVGFSYTGEPYTAELPEEQKTASSLQVADTGTFVPTANLNLPEGMEIPMTIKQHKIIMKTGKFVANHGAQMEIVLMTKQSGNPSFNFMSFDNYLNPYYKHIIHQIKTGRLKCNEENGTESSKEGQENHVQFNIPQVTPNLTPGAATVPKPSTAHCTYSNLISKIREKQKASGVEESEIYSPSAPSSPVIFPAVVAATPAKERTPVTVQAGSTGPLVSGVPVVALVDYPSFNQTVDDSSEDDENRMFDPRTVSVGVEAPKVYDYNEMTWPLPEMQMVIDKMACYIVKNGPAFLELVKNRKDPRFAFLNAGHEFNAYFQCKLQLYSEVYGDTFSQLQETPKSGPTPTKSNNIQRTKYSSKGRAISFSIKSKEVEAPLSSHTTFIVESSTSDEDMDEEEKDNRRAAREQKRQERKMKEEKIRREREAMLTKEKTRKEIMSNKAEEGGTSDNDDLYDIFKYAQNIAKDNMGANESHQKTQSKQQERKMKAAAFLGKLRKGDQAHAHNGSPPIYGPHLPVLVKANVDLLKPAEDIPSSSSSTHSGSINDRLKNSPSPAPSASEDSTRNWLINEIAKSPKQPNNNIDAVSSPFVGELQDETTEYSGPVSPKEDWSRSRHRKCHKRSRSRSLERNCDRKKSKKSRSGHRKKRHHSRSRSRERSKHHRSSHKRKKHSSHRDRSKSKKKRKYRSPSLSSVSSNKSSSNFPSDSDSEVQVISPTKVKEAVSSRSSSVTSVTDVKLSSVVQSGGDSSSTEATSAGVSSTISYENSKPNIALALAASEETTSSLSDLQENDKKSIFNPSKSTAMAKITEGLRAKLHAMLEKGANV